jgi:hypothetical protein
VSDATAALEAVLDELERGEAVLRRARRLVCELGEGIEEGEVGRYELAAALAGLEAAGSWVDALLLKRRELEAGLDRLEVTRVHAARLRR